jgi:hypothetical protein
MVVNIDMKIIPDKVIISRKIYEITRIDKSLHINGFKIYLDKDKNITEVIVNGKHPNADPRTNVLCLSEEVIGKPLEVVGIPMLYSFISLFNLDHCYFRPWDLFYIRKE